MSIDNPTSSSSTNRSFDLWLEWHPRNYYFYFKVVSGLKIDFNDPNFNYAGAQYSKFAKHEIIPLFIQTKDCLKVIIFP